MDLLEVLKSDCRFVYYLKLTNGDSLIGKSDDEPDVINERGAVELFDVMKTTPRLIQAENGNIQEILSLNPWLDACDLSTVVSVPAEAIIAIATVKEHIANKYLAYVLTTKIKDAARDALDSGKETAKVASAMHQSLEVEPQEPRQPELLTREKMHEAEMNGDIEEVEDERPNSVEPDPHYRVNDITYH